MVLLSINWIFSIVTLIEEINIGIYVKTFKVNFEIYKLSTFFFHHKTMTMKLMIFKLIEYINFSKTDPERYTKKSTSKKLDQLLINWTRYRKVIAA